MIAIPSRRSLRFRWHLRSVLSMIRLHAQGQSTSGAGRVLFQPGLQARIVEQVRAW